VAVTLRLAGRVVFTMAWAHTEEIGALAEESGSAFIQKPFEAEKSLGVLQRVLSQTGYFRA